MATTNRSASSTRSRPVDKATVRAFSAELRPTVFTSSLFCPLFLERLQALAEYECAHRQQRHWMRLRSVVSTEHSPSTSNAQCRSPSSSLPCVFAHTVACNWSCELLGYSMIKSVGRKAVIKRPSIYWYKCAPTRYYKHCFSSLRVICRDGCVARALFYGSFTRFVLS